MNLEEILRQASEISKGVIFQEASKIDKNALWPKKSLNVIKQSGLAGLVVPEKNGGLGQGLYGLVRVCEILGENCASTSMCFGMHSVATAVIGAKATEQQKKDYLEPIAEGKHLTTLALSEPGTGAHFYFPQTKLMLVSENVYKVNGIKTFVTNGGYADSYVVSTIGVEQDAPSNQFSCIVIDKSANGMAWGAAWNGIGMRGNSSRRLEINDVIISSNNLLGEKGDQLWYVFNVVAPYFLIAMAGTYLGVAQSAFNEAQNNLISRTYSHSGTSLAQNSILQHRLGMMWAKIERTRRLIYHAALEGDKGEFGSVLAILSAKAEVAHCAVDVVNEAMTIAGGIGYRENSKLDILLRDARAAHVMAPTTDILYTWLGRSLLDQPILSE